MKLSRLTPVLYVVWLVFFMVANNILPVTDPVESNYALTAKEMVLSGNWLSPQIYGTYWYDKPIMIYWLIALAFKIFGIADWVVRLPSAIFGACHVPIFTDLQSTVARWFGRLLYPWYISYVLGCCSWCYHRHGIVIYDLDGYDVCIQRVE